MFDITAGRIPIANWRDLKKIRFFFSKIKNIYIFISDLFSSLQSSLSLKLDEVWSWLSICFRSTCPWPSVPTTRYIYIYLDIFKQKSPLKMFAKVTKSSVAANKKMITKSFSSHQWMPLCPCFILFVILTKDKTICYLLY